MLSDPRFSACLRINLNALTRNYRLCQSMTRARVAGVVKANAYGTGAVPVSQALYDSGCRNFFVATLNEALDLRTALPPDAEIYILGGLYHGAETLYHAQNLHPVLNDRGMIERWSYLAKNMGEILPAVVHIDTGMNRLGLEYSDLQHIQNTPDILAGLDVRYVLSHFVASDEKDHPLNAQQADMFKTSSALFAQAKKSLANSSGLFRNPEWHHDLVRPGYALYGGNPTPETHNPMSPVVSLSARVLQVRDVPAGSSIGYNATYRFPEDTKTATLALGYADGLLRSGSSHAHVYWQGQACPIRGRISMDLISVDIGHLQGALPRPGDEMEILGPHQDIDALAQGCKTIGYEILTSLGARYQRIYTP